ncbi:hypothetical protein ACFQ0B_51695 [Nonomuraea thailandensis]
MKRRPGRVERLGDVAVHLGDLPGEIARRDELTVLVPGHLSRDVHLPAPGRHRDVVVERDVNMPVRVDERNSHQISSALL